MGLDQETDAEWGMVLQRQADKVYRSDPQIQDIARFAPVRKIELIFDPLFLHNQQGENRAIFRQQGFGCELYLPRKASFLPEAAKSLQVFACGGALHVVHTDKR